MEDEKGEIVMGREGEGKEGRMGRGGEGRGGEGKEGKERKKKESTSQHIIFKQKKQKRNILKETKQIKPFITEEQR